MSPVDLIIDTEGSAAHQAGPGGANQDNQAAGAAAEAARVAGQAAPAQSNGAGGVIDNGAGVWLDTLPPDLKTNPALGKFKNGGPEGLARGYLNLERLVGMDKLPLPKDPNDKDAWDHVYKALGRPDDPKGYEFRKPAAAELPAGANYDDGLETWWRQSALEAGLSKSQAAKLHEQYLKNYVANVQLQSTIDKNSENTCKAALHRDWGDEYEVRRALVNSTFRAMPPTLQDKIANSPLKRDPEFLKFLADRAAATRGELEAKIGQDDTGLAAPADIKTAIANHRSTFSAELMTRAHPDHELRVKQLEDLYQRLYPEAEK